MPTRNEFGRVAVSALATVTVLVGGTVVLVFVIVVSTDQPGPYIATLAASVLVTCLLLFLLRSQPEDSSKKRRPWWSVFRRRAIRPEPQITIKRRNDPGPDLDDNQPPTVEQVRDLKEHGSTWVPNRAAKQR